VAYASFEELLGASAESGGLGRAVLAREARESGLDVLELRARMQTALAVMREAVETGLAGHAHSRSGLIGGDAARVMRSASGPLGGVFASVLAAALATGEVNASMGRIVAAPTGGASGVLPAILLNIGAEYGASEDQLVDALFAAAGIGGVIASRATLAGAIGGCQAEIGSGSAMAAAAAVQLAGGTAEQSGHAAAFALQGLMGLVCDPVGGLVEIPCVFRNATGAAVALSAAEMALAGVEFPIPLDQVVDAMDAVGRALPPSLRETSLGGLAVTPCGRDLAATVASTPHTH